MEANAVKNPRGEIKDEEVSSYGRKDAWLSYLFVSLQLVASIVLILGTLEFVHAADFFCPSGDVTCLIATINSANGMPGEHIINLEPGSYTLQAVDNGPVSVEMGYR